MSRCSDDVLDVDLHHFWLTYFVKSNYENNLHSLDIMQTTSSSRERTSGRPVKRAVLTTQCAEAAYPIVIWPDWKGLIKSEGATRLLIPTEQRSMTTSNLLKCHTSSSCQDGSVHSTRRWSLLCRSLGQLIPKLVLSLSPLIPINETFSPHKKIWEMTAILVLESEIPPRGCVNIVA